MEYGEKIAALRKTKGMTQAELGKELNVTYQAVSKWERGESEPDFGTLSKLARIFGVPITYFEDEDSAITAPAPAISAPAPVMLGVCTVCGKVIYEGSEGETQPALVCADCVARREEAKENAEKEKRLKAQRQKEADELNGRRMRNKGLIVSAIICAILIAIVIVGVITDPTDAGMKIGSWCIGLLFLYPFFAQLFWHGLIVDVCLCGVKIIGTPGIIFTFDLDGFIFLIAMKILFAVIKLLVLFLCMFFFVSVAIIMSPFAFIPALVKLNNGILPD